MVAFFRCRLRNCRGSFQLGVGVFCFVYSAVIHHLKKFLAKPVSYWPATQRKKYLLDLGDTVAVRETSEGLGGRRKLRAGAIVTNR